MIDIVQHNIPHCQTEYEEYLYNIVSHELITPVSSNTIRRHLRL